MAEAPLVYPRSIPTQVPGDSPGSSAIRGQDSFGTTVVDYLKIKIYRSAEGNPYTKVGGIGGSSEGALYKTIYLYLPQGLKEEYGAEYNQVTLGAAGMGAMQALQNGTTGDDLLNTLQQTAGAAKPEFVMNKVASAIGLVNSTLGMNTSGLDADTIGALTKKRIFNPYQETTFRGTTYRNHSFNFKCQPRNAKEASELYDIIQCLRLAMLPGEQDGTPVGFAGDGGNALFNNMLSSKSGSGSGRWLTIPDYFRLELVRIEGKPSESGDLDITSGQPTGLKKIMQFPLKMVLANFSIDLTPDGPYNSLKDIFDSITDYGPAAFNMSLTFNETAFLTKNSIR